MTEYAWVHFRCYVCGDPVQMRVEKLPRWSDMTAGHKAYLTCRACPIPGTVTKPDPPVLRDGATLRRVK